MIFSGEPVAVVQLHQDFMLGGVIPFNALSAH
jgi:hypothetical protein